VRGSLVILVLVLSGCFNQTQLTRKPDVHCTATCSDCEEVDFECRYRTSEETSDTALTK